MTIYTNVDRAPTQRAAAHALRDAAPWLSKADHKRRRKALIRALMRIKAAHTKGFHRAAMDAWGREFRITDYRVSGIGSDEFSNAHKARLRRLSRARSKVQNRLGAHAWAAQYLSRK